MATVALVVMVRHGGGPGDDSHGDDDDDDDDDNVQVETGDMLLGASARLVNFIPLFVCFIIKLLIFLFFFQVESHRKPEEQLQYGGRKSQVKNTLPPQILFSTLQQNSRKLFFSRY